MTVVVAYQQISTRVLVIEEAGRQNIIKMNTSQHTGTALGVYMIDSKTVAAGCGVGDEEEQEHRSARNHHLLTSGSSVTHPGCCESAEDLILDGFCHTASTDLQEESPNPDRQHGRKNAIPLDSTHYPSARRSFMSATVCL